MQYSKGFTLIEMLVTVSLIIIITSATLLNFNSLGDAFDLDREVQSVAQDIKNAISMTMALEEYEGAPADRIVAYGIRFINNSDEYERIVYFINPDDPTDGLTTSVLETVRIEKSKIVSIKTSQIGVSRSEIVIVFVPPHPKTFIGTIGSSWTSQYDNAYIEIASKSDSTNTRTINVNKYGRIEIQ